MIVIDTPEVQFFSLVSTDGPEIVLCRVNE